MFPSSYFIQNVVNMSFNMLSAMMLSTYSATYAQMYKNMLPSNNFYNLHVSRPFLLFFTSLLSMLCAKYHDEYNVWCMRAFTFTFAINIVLVCIESLLCPVLVIKTYTGVEVVVFITTFISFFGYCIAYVYYKCNTSKKAKTYTRVQVHTKEECSICFQANIEEQVQLECKHAFHHACIEEWFEQQMEKIGKKSCPNCRYEIV
jgi:hypothetical protein